MKRLKHLIYSGVSVTEDGKFHFDYFSNSASDLIDVIEPQLYTSIHGNKLYRFGYRFNSNSSRGDRTRFLHFLKGIGDYVIDEAELERFISRPLAVLDDLYNIDCLVYPLSGRSELVSKIVKTVNRFTSHDMSRFSYELVKSIPIEIEFDWNSFESDHGDEYGYSQMKDYVEKELLPKIHSLDYFSLADSVKLKYRKYITNYLEFSSDKAKEISNLDNRTILVIDDMNTSGSTLDEILRILGRLNNSCEIYIYTLIGK